MCNIFDSRSIVEVVSKNTDFDILSKTVFTMLSMLMLLIAHCQ